MQREVGDEDDELGEGAPHLGARALEQVLGEAVGIRKQDVVCKPIADILTVSEQDAEGVVPAVRGAATKMIFFYYFKRIKNPVVVVVAKPRWAGLTSHWQDPALLSWCGNLC